MVDRTYVVVRTTDQGDGFDVVGVFDDLKQANDEAWKAQGWIGTIGTFVRSTDARLSEITRLRSDNQKLREALEPFGTSHVAENVDEHGWTSNIHREQISVWFGPSDFFRARAALAEGNSNG